jgi:hypothetical protein
MVFRDGEIGLLEIIRQDLSVKRFWLKFKLQARL